MSAAWKLSQLAQACGKPDLTNGRSVRSAMADSARQDGNTREVIFRASYGQPGEIHHHSEKARDNAQRQDTGRPDQNKPADPLKPHLCGGGWVRSHQ
jgi:hypothetical protein